MFQRSPDLDVDESVDVCSHCGLHYHAFRTGLTFSDVRSLYWVANPDSSTWKYKRRNTVLGKWREIKIEMWAEHLYMCAEEALWDEVPF
jgi:hypothetical protein